MAMSNNQRVTPSFPWCCDLYCSHMDCFKGRLTEWRGSSTQSLAPWLPSRSVWRAPINRIWKIHWLLGGPIPQKCKNHLVNPGWGSYPLCKGPNDTPVGMAITQLSGDETDGFSPKNKRSFPTRWAHLKCPVWFRPPRDDNLEEIHLLYHKHR